MNVILASKSPRRRELLGKMFRAFEIDSLDVDETLPEGVPVSDGVAELAVRKGEAVKDKWGDEYLIISSDTLVELDGVPLGKPEDEGEARKMLLSLSGRRHNVHTGVAVHYLGRVEFGTASTAVYFRELDISEIDRYIATGEPMDKAGAYGIQGAGGALVSHYDGDFDTVVGLSLTLLGELIERITDDKE